METVKKSKNGKSKNEKLNPWKVLKNQKLTPGNESLIFKNRFLELSIIEFSFLQ